MPLVLFIGLLLLIVLLYIALGGPKLPPETDAIIDEAMQSDLSVVIRGETGYAAAAGGPQIWYECLSPDGDIKATLLFNMGIAANALDWPPEFVQFFLDAGYRVIRYDQRGTGMSDWMADWDRKKPYSIADMAGDAAAVLDTLDVQRAHVLGLSQGGMVAQELALRQPERVISLTLLMTSGFIGDPELPSLTTGFVIRSLISGLPLSKYRIRGGEKNLIKERIAKWLTAFDASEMDMPAIVSIALYDLRERRGTNMRAFFQHQAAVTVAGSRYEGLRELQVPTLIVHGEDDQLIPVEHGRKLAETIPNAEAIWLEGVGHVFPLPEMDAINQRILAHMSAVD